MKLFHNQKGTTLIEMLLAMAVFSIFISIAVGGFVQSLSSQRIALKLMAANDNIGLALEQIAREARVASNFFASANFLSFTNSYNQDISYVLEEEKIYRRVSENGIETKNDSITADNVSVYRFESAIIPNPNNIDSLPPRVVINIGISVTDKGDEVRNEIQTVVSPRVF